MRKLKLFQCFCLLLCIVYGTSYNSNAQMICGTPDPDTPQMQYPSIDGMPCLFYNPSNNCQWTAACRSDIFQNYFAKKESFIPWQGSTQAAHVRKKIKMKFYLINPVTPTKKNYNSSDYSFLQQVVAEMNTQWER